MAEIKIDISELKREGSDIIKELAEYLKEKTTAEVATGADSITVKGEKQSVSKKYLRVFLKKFLHKKELKDYYRVIGGEENSLIVKEKKISEEE
ncbi:MAG: 60S ribosomal protein L22 [Candidatus Bathyarchaeota archaeon]|nr:60S ribosomal protein L22 [Candidatus Bathyarchaeota archaeon]